MNNIKNDIKNISILDKMLFFTTTDNNNPIIKRINRKVKLKFLSEIEITKPINNISIEEEPNLAMPKILNLVCFKQL